MFCFYRLFIQFQNISTITDIIMYTFVFSSSPCQYVFITFVYILTQCSIFNGKTIYSSIMHTNLKKYIKNIVFVSSKVKKKQKHAKLIYKIKIDAKIYTKKNPDTYSLIFSFDPDIPIASSQFFFSLWNATHFSSISFCCCSRLFFVCSDLLCNWN